MKHSIPCGSIQCATCYTLVSPKADAEEFEFIPMKAGADD